MADTIKRWSCGCGSFRFKVAGIDTRTCQGCGIKAKKVDGLWFAAGKEEK
jgi:hypothetical protein